MSILKKLAGQTVIYGLSSIVGRLLNLFLTPLWSNTLGTAGFGIITRVYSGVTFSNVILTFGMETTFFRFLQDSKDPKSTFNHAFAWVTFMASSMLIISLIFHQQLVSWIDHEDGSLIAFLISGIVFLDALAALPMAKLRHEEKAMRFTLINLCNIVAAVSANYIFIDGLGKGVLYVFIANFIASCIRLSLALIGNMPTSLRINWKRMRGMLDYAFFIMIAGFAGTMNETFDRLILKDRWGACNLFNGEWLTGDEITGIYGANYKVAMLIVLFTQAYKYAAEPFFFKEANKKDSPMTFAKIFHYFTLSTLIGFLLLSSFAQEIVSFNFWGLFSRSFIDQEFWSGTGVIPILLLAYVFSAAYINISIWFKITKQTRFALLFTGTGAFLTILINWFSIPTYGYIGSAWATLVCYLVMSMMVYIIGQKHYPIPYKIGRMGMYLALFFAAYFINAQVGPSGGDFAPFGMKAFICLIALATVFVLEKAYPVFEEEGASASATK